MVTASQILVAKAFMGYFRSKFVSCGFRLGFMGNIVQRVFHQPRYGNEVLLYQSFYVEGEKGSSNLLDRDLWHIGVLPHMCHSTILTEPPMPFYTFLR